MKLVLSVVSLAVLGSAFGQHGGSMGRGGFSSGRMTGVGILMMSEVQKELKLTPPQKMLLEKALTGESVGGTKEKRVDPVVLEKSVMPILNPPQRIRYEQIKVQAAGASALAIPSVAAKLKLTAAQKKSVVAILEKAKPPTTPVTRKNFEKLRMEAGMRRDAANKSLMALLSPSQRVSFETMQGKPFAFPRLTIRGMGQPR